MKLVCLPLALLKPSRADILAGALFSVFAASTILWLMLDRAPPNWDDAWYLTNSLIVYDALNQGGIAGYLTELNSVFGFKAPLIAALPTPFYLIFGRRWHAAYLVNIASMAVLFFAMYRIARRLWNTRAAVLSIAIALIVKWRWRCLKRPDRDYWCFTHVIDSRGRIVSQFDHRLPGDSPLRSWTPGVRIADQVRLRIPAEFPAGELRLRFGLYDPRTGRRLRLGVLQELPASLFTPADQSTALLTPIK